MEKKSNKKIFIICGIILVLIIVGVVFVISRNKTNNDVNVGKDNVANEEQYTTLLKDVVKIGDYVQYEPIEEEFTLEKSETGYDLDQKFKTSKYTGKWRIMYNDIDNGLQIISSSGVQNWAVLGGKFGYNNAVDTLNSFCNHYANNNDYAISGRCLGSNPKFSKDNAETQQHYSAGAMKNLDENYKYDLDVLNQYSLHSAGEETILASRNILVEDGWKTYYLRYISSSGDLKNDDLDLYSIVDAEDIEKGMKAINPTITTNRNGRTNSQYIRPIITLKEDIKVKSGDGTKDNPYILAK
ncbi:MAG: hypothetical protein V8R72_00225 [Clostridia bacterium]